MRLGFLMLMAVTALGFSGCGRMGPAEPAPPAAAELAEVIWRLEQLGDHPLAVPDNRRPYVEFEPESSRVTGFTGCNRMFGNLRIDGQSLRLEELAMTKMACPDIMELERKFLEMLELVRGWRGDRHHLELLGGNGESLARFIADPASPEQDP
jgi:heat shock protein HslJ